MKRVALLVTTSFLISACSHGRVTPAVDGSTSAPGVSQTPSGGTFLASAFKCPSSDTATTSSVARATSIEVASLGKRPVATHHSAGTPVTPSIAVTYDAASLARSRTLVAAREQRVGATLVREYAFPHTGLATRVVNPGTGSITAIESALRALPGVKSVGLTGFRRHALSVNQPYLGNEPYFKGVAGGSPLYQTSTVDGQWDKHVVRLEDAFAYSQSGNGSGITNGNALGSPSVKIAIIDSGEDTTHPDLASVVQYQKCFITNPDNAQSNSSFVTDPDGHGTNVAGIAAADSGNGFGFTGSAGLASIYAYRVFPTPDDNCLDETTTDSQCSTISADIISAIQDAVAQNVNVINLSLGAGGDDACSTTGVDPDTAEGAAIADAIAANIVVVASAGNDNGGAIDAPACDTGVIAAGATALSDGQTNATGSTVGTSGTPREYVASYSNIGSPAAAFANADAWGIVAPGGDALSGTDADYLHWIDNIWTSTPFDDNFAGECIADASSASAIDCRELIDGTSMSSPAVAGAAALIIAANSTYQSPTKMKQLLCTTADDIGDANEGCGRLDVYRAMAVALKDPNEPSTRAIP